MERLAASNKPKRIDWIDALKGIGIILVILGHSLNTQSPYRAYIYLFHMPLFFFVSGYLFQKNRDTKFSAFLLKKGKSLLVPYFFFSIAAIVLRSIFYQMPPTLKADLLQFFFSARDKIGYDIPLWFLTALFLVEVFYFLTAKLTKRPVVTLCVCVAISFVGNYISTKYVLPWSFGWVLYYLGFYGIGDCLRTYHCIRKARPFYLTALFCTVLNLFVFFKPQLYKSFLCPAPSSFILTTAYYVFTALACIISYIAFAKMVDKSKLLNYLGKNTLTIFSFESIFTILIFNSFKAFGIKVVLSNAFSIIFCAIMILLMVPAVKIINTYFPFMLGKFNFQRGNIFHQNTTLGH